MYNPCTRRTWHFCSFVFIILLLVVTPATALYDFEGVPLNTVAEGKIQGDLLIFSAVGLDVPPREIQFELPGDVEWARVYSGIWGGTEKYTGWITVSINGQTGEKITLYGVDDKAPGVYASGHGVYWVAKDATSFLKKGMNTVKVMTSRGEIGNKLDGRVYGVVVVALVKTPGGHITRYWIAEGNENLHGEGWSGNNPTQHLSSNISFTGADIGSVISANITTVLLASNSGQPDYITFNDHDLGQPLTGSDQYPEHARDIGDERSFNAGGAVGIDSRYMDLEVMDVAPYLRNTNTVTFELGRDLDKDRAISTTGQKPEGEDYIHPCLAMLAIVTSGTAETGPDILMENLRIVDAYEGTNSTILVTLRNQGTAPNGATEVILNLDGNEIWRNTPVLDPSGVMEISIPWQAVSGAHTVEIDARVEGDTNPSNNRITKDIVVSSPPDILISAETPYRSAASPIQTQKSPVGYCIPLISIGIFLIIAGRNPKITRSLAPILLVAGIVSLTVLSVPVAASDNPASYILPVNVCNQGGSATPSFEITLYLDGEKTLTKTVEPGLAAGESRRIELSIYASHGPHIVRIIADESGKVTKKDTTANVFESAIEFP